MSRAPKTMAVAGIFDHGGWAIVVSVSGRAVVDSRRIELVEPGLPKLPHHGPGQKLPIDKAVALVERVRASAEACARSALDELPAAVGGIAIRKRPALPPTVAERITSYWAQTRADTVMYREALAAAAGARGWSVCEYDPKTVFARAADVLGNDEEVSVWLEDLGRNIGPPWRKDHRLAAAAAIAAARKRGKS